jgi:hypothetical protein
LQLRHAVPAGDASVVGEPEKSQTLKRIGFA